MKVKFNLNNVVVKSEAINVDVESLNYEVECTPAELLEALGSLRELLTTKQE